MTYKMLFAGSLIAVTMSLGACGDNSTPATAPSGSTSASTTDMATAAKAQADKLLSDAANYIKDNKWHLADKAVAQLDALKPQLPPDYATRIEDLKSALAAAKAAAAKMPAGVKMPG